MRQFASSGISFIRPKKSGLSLDMAPLIDIVFQLLIFFMLSSSFLTPSMKLALPKAVQHDTKTPESLVVSVDKEGLLYLNTQKISMNDLESELQSRLSQNSQKAVHVRGDKDMPYHYFVEVMDKARNAGAKQINIVHDTGVSKGPLE